MDLEFELNLRRSGVGHLLRQHDIEALDNHSGTIYAVWADFTLAYMNKAWFDFSGSNNARNRTFAKWTIGRNFIDAISGNLKFYYEDQFKTCLATPEGNWRHEYECSSASVFRKFHMDVSVLGEQEGLLIVHSLVIEKPHGSEDPTEIAKVQSDYLTEHGLIRQCSSCRCVERQLPTPSWEWVPQYISEMPPNTTHGLCPACIGRYFPTT